MRYTPRTSLNVGIVVVIIEEIKGNGGRKRKVANQTKYQSPTLINFSNSTGRFRISIDDLNPRQKLYTDTTFINY